MVNMVTLIGNLGSDPELKYTNSGAAVCTFNIATSEKWKDKSTGEGQERTEWHRIVVWAAQAESCAKYLQKGAQVFINGKIQSRKWKDDSGQENSITEIAATNVKFLSTKQ
jgi:single-strand DNA-binding protein